jgi:hypothetical protein
MFGLGKLVAAPIRLVNAPLRAIEKVVDYTDGTHTPKSERIISTPLECIAEAIEEAIDGEKRK